MRTIFERSFASGFGARPIHGFRPFRSLGQFSFDPNEVPSGGETTQTSPFSFDPNQAPISTDQGQTYSPPAPVPYVPTPGVAPKVPAQQPPGMSDTDWAKLLAQGITAAGTGYGVYSKAEVDKMNAQAAALKARNPGIASILPSGMDTTTVILVVLGGVAVIGIGLMLALKQG